MLVGEAHAGKSSFARALLTAAAAKGRQARLLDADLGQAMIGPPACVTLARLDPSGRLARTGLAFVGHVSPVEGWERLIAGLTRLGRRAQAHPLVVNTGGLPEGLGAGLTAAQLAAARPTLLVTIGDRTGVAADLPILHLPSSPAARRKGRGERRAVRAAAFAAYFARARIVTLDIATLAQARSHQEGALPPPGLLVGLPGPRDDALGLVVAVDQEGGVFQVLTPARRPPQRLTWGGLLLDGSFRSSKLEGFVPGAGAGGSWGLAVPQASPLKIHGKDP